MYRTILNAYRYKFIIGLIAASSFLLTIIFINREIFNRRKSVTTTLRTLAPIFVPISRVDPAKIRDIAEYQLCSWIYSPLIEYSEDGQLIGSVADKFYWEGTDLVFEIAKDRRSSKGDLITAEDVEYSFKRLFVLSTNSHGDLQNLLCSGKVLKNINDSCSGIVSNGQKLRLKFDQKRHYLLPMLANMDFAIIPRKAISSENLSILDYTNGTGPYQYVSENIDHEEMLLEARPDHIRYSSKIPQRVQLKTWRKPNGELFTSEESLTLLSNNQIDFIPTTAFPDLNASVEISISSKEIQLFKTKNIGLSLLAFTEKGKGRFTPVQRLALGSIIRQRFSDYYVDNQYGRTPTVEYFPRMGAGHLEQSDLRHLDEFISEEKGRLGIKKLKVSVKASAYQLTKKILGDIKEIELISVSKNPLFHQTNEINFPDVHISVTDVSFNEDFNLLSYTQALGFFPYDDIKNREWLNQYMREEQTDVRLDMMRKLHLDMLKAANVVPIAALPYMALIKKPWTIKFSDLFAGSPLWQIEIED